MPLPRSLEYHIQRALTYAERLFKTDVRYLLKGGFWGVVGQTASSLSALALSVIFSRMLPKEVYGEYKYVLAFISVLGALSLSGLSTSVFQSAARGFGGALPEGFWTNLRWSVAVFFSALVGAAYYFYTGQPALGIAILVGGCFSPIIASGNLYSSLLSGKKDFRRFSIYGLFNTIFPVVALIATVFITTSFLALVTVYFIANALIGLILYLQTCAQYKTEITESEPGTITYAKHLSVIGVLSTIAGNIDQLFLFNYLGAIELAIYNFAVGVLDQTKGPLKMLDTMTQARFATTEARSVEQSMYNKMWLLFLTIGPFVIVYILAAPYIYQILFPAYTSSVIYSQVYALSLLSLVLSPAASFLYAKREVKAQYISTVVNSIFQIGVTILGIVFWGLWGLIAARVLSRTIGALVLYMLYLRSMRTAAD